MDERRNRREKMVSSKIYLEGGGDASVLRKRYAQAFHAVLDPICGLSKPRIVAKGSRTEAFNALKTGLNDPTLDVVFLLIDSEDPVENNEKTWEHLANRRGDQWVKPENASDKHILFMTTAVETWVLADIKVRKGMKCDKSMESLTKESVRQMLSKMTGGRYDKSIDIQSEFIFEINPNNLSDLPSFARVRRILQEKLTA